jgi:gamma-glutamyltranspeptidase/glutathione hydrolase
MKQNLLLLFYCLATGACAQQIVGVNGIVDPYHYKQVKQQRFTHAAVASAHPLASQVGAAILQQGGNAFDAAIAVQLTLAVVYPGAGNIGGGGFLLARTAGGKNLAIDYRETAPAAASRDMYLDSNGNANTHLSQNGHLAAGVPGTVAGLFALLPYARLPFQRLIQPAIDLATHGFAITEAEARGFNESKAAFEQYNTAPIAFVRPQPWKAGDTLYQPDLARTLVRIREAGAKGFYEGETARLLVAEMQRGHGALTLADLKQYKAKVREALSFTYRGYEIMGFPPPSSGGILLAQMLKMIEPYPIGQYNFLSARMVQLMTEAERRAYADRAEHLGDPDFYRVPVATLLSSAYLRQRMADYDSTKATPSRQIKAGNAKESDETTHISIADRDGNVVAITTTLNGHYGSKTVVGGAGFLLNNEMDDFSIKPGVPNMYGAVGGEANAIQPGKRMLSSMAPTLVLRSGKPVIVAGTPGGTTIPTSVFQTIVDMIDFRMSPANAIRQPKFHHQWQPDEVFTEIDFPPATTKALQAMGYTVTTARQIGRMEIIRLNADGSREAAADTRGDDSVAGW